MNKAKQRKAKEKQRKAKEAQREERRTKVAQLLIRGLSYREIRDAVGCSLGTVHNDVQHILRELHEEQNHSAELWRAKQVRKLEAMERKLMGRALQGDVKAIDRELKIQERLAKYKGLDAPQEVNIGSRQEMERLLSTVVNALGSHPEAKEAVLEAIREAREDFE